MSLESILILCGVCIICVFINYLFRYIKGLAYSIKELSDSVEKIDGTLSVMMQTDEQNTKKVISTVEKVVANSIDDLRTTSDIVDKYNEDELYDEISTLFDVSEEFYTIDQLQKIFRVEYVKMLHVLHKLKDDGVITHIKSKEQNTLVWVSSDYREEEENESVDEDDEDADEEDDEII